MKVNERWDIVFSIASWLIVVALIVAAVTMLFSTPTGAGPVAGWIGATGAKWFYAILYGSEAIALTVAKMFRRKVFRKHVLMVIYLTGFFTTALSLLNIGLSIKLLDNLAISVLAAGCWLYWKFRIDYIDPSQFDGDINQLRTDMPRRVD